MKPHRFPKTERHTSTTFLMRVPANLAPVATAILSDFLKCRVRKVYRDKSTDRPRRYMRSEFWQGRGVTCVSGCCKKKDATHADLYAIAPQIPVAWSDPGSSEKYEKNRELRNWFTEILTTLQSARNCLTKVR